MTTKTIGTALGARVLESEYFVESVRTLELVCARCFVYGVADEDMARRLESLDVHGILRFADILSHSQDHHHREIAYGLIALLQDLASHSIFSPEIEGSISGFTEAIMIELGNFPAIRTLRRKTSVELVPSLLKEATRALKMSSHETNRGGEVFTDAQASIVEKMQGANFFSFSGPTSLGKSFIIKDSLYALVQKPELEGRSIVVLVPTKALISQTASDLREVLSDVTTVHVSSHPRLSYFLRHRFSRTVFVFTPERLLSYLSEAPRNVDYLFVDEAQKVISENDTRSPLFYHAINETLRKFATKLIFASPNIDNPEIFLQLFQKSTDGSISVPERSVSQQRYLVDLLEDATTHFAQVDNSLETTFKNPTSWKNKFDVVKGLARSNQSIVYINSARNTVISACEFAASLPNKHDPRLDALAELAAENVHEDYYLIECLKKGVAFHHGRMPQDLRDKIEELFSDRESPIQYIFCTSTLLEGVNLPAKNIFVFSDRHGLKSLTRLDFENLIGRAGRLTYDFSGNVVCVRDKETTWEGKTKDLINASKSYRAESFLVNPAPRRKKEYTDIEKVLTGKPLPKNRSAESRKATEQYASILTLHDIDGQSSPLKDYFLDRVENGKDILKKISSDINVPKDILRSTPDIRTGHQDAIWSKLTSTTKFEPLVDHDDDLSETSTYHRALLRLYEDYGWDQEESIGTYPIVPKRRGSMAPVASRLKYWANLMRNWTAGKPLNQIIKASINYYESNGSITFRDYSTESTYTTEEFIKTDPRHINLVIEETLLDIEVGLRFRIIRYLQNYHQLARRAVGDDDAGLDLASLVEYGTADLVSIALQDAGLSRAVSLKLAKKYRYLVDVSDDGELMNVNIEMLLRLADDDKEIVGELKEVFPDMIPSVVQDI